MNEQIEQLWNNVDLQEEGNPPSIVITTERELQEFAELIIKDCIGVIRTRYMGDNNREDMEVLKCIDLLKQHYGIQQ